MDFLWHLWQQKCKNSCEACAYARVRRRIFRKVCTLKKQNWERGENDWVAVSNEWQNLLAAMQDSVKKTTCCSYKSDVSFCWKQRVVLLKTTCRFVENNVSFCWKQRVVLLKTTCCFVEYNVLFCWIQRVVWTERRERVINIPVFWEKSVGASAQRRWKGEVFGHVSGKAYFCTA